MRKPTKRGLGLVMDVQIPSVHRRRLEFRVVTLDINLRSACRIRTVYLANKRPVDSAREGRAGSQEDGTKAAEKVQGSFSLK